MEQLPPDLTRLGRELSAAIDQSLYLQRLRRRIMRRAATIGSCGALLFVVMTPALLSPAFLESRRASSDQDQLVCEASRTRAERAPTCFTAVPVAAWLPDRLADR